MKVDGLKKLKSTVLKSKIGRSQGIKVDSVQVKNKDDEYRFRD